MARGHKTGGRKPGSRNRRTKERETATAETISKIEEALDEPFQGDAHALLIALYKDQSRPIEVRLDAAKAAIRFEKPSLASQAVDLKGSLIVSHEDALAELDE
jgi:hypothetical protein